MNVSKIWLALVGLTTLAVCDVASGAGATPVFNYPNGFNSASSMQYGGSATLQGSAINLTAGHTEHQGGGVGYKAAQNITAFTTDFTFQLAKSGMVPSIQCLAFVVQNTNSKDNPGSYGPGASDDANLCGYGSFALDNGQHPMIHSIGVTFNLNNYGQNNYPSGGLPNSTGLFINSGPQGQLGVETDLNPSGINFYSSHVMAVHIVYDGSILTMTLRDTVTNAQFRTSWPIDIPTIMGGNSAWVGFTAGEIPPVANDVLSWSFTEGYPTRLAAPSFSVAAGLYPSEQTVSLSAPSGGTIYYTTNGTQPTTSSTKYTGPIPVASTEVVQAVAIEPGYTDSFVSVANYRIGPAGTPLINFPNGFANASHLVTTNGSARINGSALQLTDTSRQSESGSAWYVVPVNVQSFSTNFTLNLQNAQANGMTFVIQNEPPASTDGSILYVSGGPNALASNGTGLGYSGGAGQGAVNAGLLNSMALIFDLYGGGGDQTGLYMNGAMPAGSSINLASSGLSLHSGNPIAVTLGYDGSTLKMTMVDTKSRATFSKEWTINIPSIVGGKTAYVGFTGATGGLNATQDVTAWTYTAASSQQAEPVPAAPTNLRVQ